MTLVIHIQTHTHTLIESDTQVLSPYRLQYVDIIENKQRRFTKVFPGSSNVYYLDRLEHLQLRSF